jgi:hypothetical protein
LHNFLLCRLLSLFSGTTLYGFFLLAHAWVSVARLRCPWLLALCPWAAWTSVQCRDPVKYWLSGGEFVKAVHVRYQLLRTGERKTHGVDRLQGGRDCTLCRTVQSLAHIVQMCPRTHGLIVRRHNDLVTVLAASAQCRGWNVIREPCTRTKTLFVKLDLVLTKAGRGLVLDPCITGCSDKSLHKGRDKVDMYRAPEIEEFVSNVCLSQGQEIECLEVAPILVTWRGTWEPEMTQLLRGLQIPRNLIEYWTVKLLNV